MEMRSQGLHTHVMTGALVLGLTFAWASVAQDLPKSPLRLQETVPIGGLQSRGIINPVKCDSRGNIYLRFHQPRPFTAPVVRISPDGELKSTFSLQVAKGWEGGEIYDFAPQTDGSLYVLGARRGSGRTIEHGILTFDEEGKFRSAIPLNATLTSVDRLAVFATGEFLVAGWQKIEQAVQKADSTGKGSTGSREDPDVEARTLVLSPAGDVIREVSLSSDFSTQSEPAAKSRLLLPGSAISLGASATGDAGEVYLMFRGPSPTVFEILPKANVVKKIDILPPTENVVALNLWYASGTGLVVLFAEKGPRGSFNTALAVISIVDPQTGARLYDYQSDAEVGGSFACYNPKGLLFVASEKNGQLTLRRAVPR